MQYKKEVEVVEKWFFPTGLCGVDWVDGYKQVSFLPKPRNERFLRGVAWLPVEETTDDVCAGVIMATEANAEGRAQR